MLSHDLLSNSKCCVRKPSSGFDDKSRRIKLVALSNDFPNVPCAWVQRPVRASDITPALDSRQFWLAIEPYEIILHFATRTLCAMSYIQKKIFSVVLACVSSAAGTARTKLIKKDP